MASHLNASQASSLRKKLVWIIPAVLLGLLIAAYFGGVIAFSLFFMPGTTLDGQDVSLMSVEDVAAEKTGSLAGYQTHVSGNGVDLTLSAEEIDLAYDGERYAREALEQTNVWAWPLEVMGTRAVSAESAVVFERDALLALIEPFVEAAQESKESLGGACVAYDPEAQSFGVDGSITALYLDLDAVVEALSVGFTAQEAEIALTDEQLSPTDDEVHQAAATANAYLGAATTTLTLEDLVAEEVTADQIAAWVSVSDAFEVSLDEDAIRAWAEEAISGFNTVGTERSYTRADGKQVSVSGGFYGWEVDGGGVEDSLVAAVSSGAAEQIEIVCTQTADAAPDESGRDWGNRYLDIDLSEQHVRLYDESGSLVFESACVTGDVTQGYDTPTGVYQINSYKGTDQTLTGLDYDKDGEPDYESHVDYWIPFYGNLVALHDADWRYQFGGTIYQGFGSHGCVNLPPDKAAELYDLSRVGDVVVVHW